MSRTGFIVAVAVALGVPGTAFAQNWPDKAVRLVVPFPPGGSTDFAARILAQHLPATLGQSFIVDNRGGAAGNIGVGIAAKAAPDGYTLLVATEGPITMNPSVYPKLPFNTEKDIPAITELIRYPNVVVLNPTVPVGSLADLIKFARSNPGKLRYSHPGAGTGPHLSAELLKLNAKVDIVSVAYKGGGPAILSVMGNETQLSVATAPSSIPHVKSGRLKAVGVTTAQRFAALPDLPTVAESGVPGYEVVGWVAMFAPAGTPAKIVERLYAETVRVLRMPEVKDMVAAAGSEVSGIPTSEMRARVRAETAMWAKVVKAADIRAE